LSKATRPPNSGSTFAAKKASRFGWVRNAFDEDYFRQLAVPSDITGLNHGQPGDPRTYGLTVQNRF